MTTATQGWSFVSVVGDGDRVVGESTDGKAVGTVVSSVKKWSLKVKIFAAIVTVVSVVGISVGIAAGAGAFNSSSDSSTITLSKVQSANCDQGTSTKAQLLMITGSANGQSSQMPVYFKFNSSGMCLTTPEVNSTIWPIYTAPANSQVTHETGVASGTGSVDSEGYLRIVYQTQSCPVYQYYGDYNSNVPLGASTLWPLAQFDPQGDLGHSTTILQSC